MCLQKLPGEQRTIQVAGGQIGIKRLPEPCRQGKDGGPGSRVVSGFLVDVAGGGIGSGQPLKPGLSGQFVVNATVSGLHAGNPIYFPAGLIQQIRNAVAALRDIPSAVDKFIRPQIVSGHEIPEGSRCRRQIFAKVAGIVPASTGIQFGPWALGRGAQLTTGE